MNKNLTGTKVADFEAFRHKVGERCLHLIDVSNCSTFKIMGYKHLSMKLILNYDDCNQVYQFDCDNDYIIKEEAFFTKPFTERRKEMGSFMLAYNADVPE